MDVPLLDLDADRVDLSIRELEDVPSPDRAEREPPDTMVEAEVEGGIEILADLIGDEADLHALPLAVPSSSRIGPYHPHWDKSPDTDDWGISVIVSHKHRFVFIRCRQTASTSLEIALSRLCGPDDIVTPMHPRAELLRADLGGRSVAPLLSIMSPDTRTCPLSSIVSPVGWSLPPSSSFLMPRPDHGPVDTAIQSVMDGGSASGWRNSSPRRSPSTGTHRWLARVGPPLSRWRPPVIGTSGTSRRSPGRGSSGSSTGGPAPGRASTRRAPPRELEREMGNEKPPPWREAVTAKSGAAWAPYGAFPPGSAKLEMVAGTTRPRR